MSFHKVWVEFEIKCPNDHCHNVIISAFWEFKDSGIVPINFILFFYTEDLGKLLGISYLLLNATFCNSFGYTSNRTCISLALIPLYL